MQDQSSSQDHPALDILSNMYKLLLTLPIRLRLSVLMSFYIISDVFPNENDQQLFLKFSEDLCRMIFE